MTYTESFKSTFGFVPAVYIRPRLKDMESFKLSEERTKAGGKTPLFMFELPDPEKFDHVAYKKAEVNLRKSLYQVYTSNA